MNGSVGVGYRLFNEIFFGVSLVMSKTKRIISPINDYSCISNKSSEFLYQPIEKAEALAIRREDFNTMLDEDPTAKKLKPFIAQNYKVTIQDPMHLHRDEMASKFESRIDYVDISAYGVGRVNVGVEKKAKKSITLNTIGDDDDIPSQNSSMSDIDEDGHKTVVLKKVATLPKSCKNINYSLNSIANRCDEKIDMIFGKKPFDSYQQHLI